MSAPENLLDDVPSVEELNQLINTFGSGAFIESERLAGSLSQRYPGASLGWKVLGALEFMAGRQQAAIGPMRRAANAAPLDAEAHFNLGVALAQLGLREEAREAYQAAIRAHPGYPEAHNNLGNLLRDWGHLNASEAAYREALRSRPGYLLAQWNLGKCLRDAGNLKASKIAYESAICVQPNYPDAYSNLGVSLKDLAHETVAIRQFRRAIQLDPALAEARNNLGIALFDCGEFHRSSATYQIALILRPEYPEALNNLGNSLRQQGDIIRANRLFHRALRLNPLYPEAGNNLGILDYDRGLLRRSIDRYQNTLASRPEYAEAYSNLGISYFTEGALERAETCLNWALRIRPNYAEAFSNLGAILKDQGRFRDAESAYQEAIGLRPDYPEAHWNAALLHLLEGDYEKGWRSYEWRFRNLQLENPPSPSTKPLWQGTTPLKNQTILLYAEQGLGDTLQFYRYAYVLKDLEAKVILEVQPELHELLVNQDETFTVIPRGTTPPDHDLVTPLMSLPTLFGTSLDTIPKPGPYLWPLRSSMTRWQALLGKKTRPRIGLVASGSQNHTEDRRRSISWQRLSPLFQLSCDFFCLQKDLRGEEVRFLQGQPEVRNLSQAINGFSDTAAIASLMDIVISVDTSVAHLAAALGKETWILLPRIPDWRWLMDREDSPWYDAARLFRQDRHGDWDSVILNVRSRLEERLPTLHSSSSFEYRV